MSTSTITGRYGDFAQTQTKVFVSETRGGVWYVASGSVNVNFTPDEVSDGVWLETLTDTDMFTAGRPVRSEGGLEQALRRAGHL